MATAIAPRRGRSKQESVTFWSPSAHLQYHFAGRRAKRRSDHDGSVYYERHDNPCAKFSPRGEGLTGGGYYETSDPEEIEMLRAKASRNPELVRELVRPEQAVTNPAVLVTSGRPFATSEPRTPPTEDDDELADPA